MAKSRQAEAMNIAEQKQYGKVTISLILVIPFLVIDTILIVHMGRCTARWRRELSRQGRRKIFENLI